MDQEDNEVHEITKGDNDILDEKPDEVNQADKETYRGNEKSKRATSESEVQKMNNLFRVDENRI